MDNGQWTMDNGQWTMQNGQWLTPVTRPIGVNLTSIPPRFHPLPNPFPIQGAGLPAPLPPCGLCWESPGRASRKGAKTQRSGQKMVFTNRVLVGEGAGGRGADVEIKRHPYAAIPPKLTPMTRSMVKHSGTVFFLCGLLKNIFNSVFHIRTRQIHSWYSWYSWLLSFVLKGRKEWL
jgi:hypothetical protein